MPIPHPVKIPTLLRSEPSDKLRDTIPIPLRNPVIDLKLLVLCLAPQLCVVQSIIVGKNKRNALRTPMERGSGAVKNAVIFTTIFEPTNPRTIPEHRAQSRNSLPKTWRVSQWLWARTCPHVGNEPCNLLFYLSFVPQYGQVVNSGIICFPQDGQSFGPVEEEAGILIGIFALKFWSITLALVSYIVLTEVPPSSTGVSSKEILPSSLSLTRYSRGGLAWSTTNRGDLLRDKNENLLFDFLVWAISSHASDSFTMWSYVSWIPVLTYHESDSLTSGDALFPPLPMSEGNIQHKAIGNNSVSKSVLPASWTLNGNVLFHLLEH